MPRIKVLDIPQYEDGGKKGKKSKVTPVYIVLPDGTKIKSDTSESSKYAQYIKQFGYTNEGYYDEQGNPVWYAPGYLEEDKPLEQKVAPMKEVTLTGNPILGEARKKAKQQIGDWTTWGKTNMNNIPEWVQNSRFANPMQDLADKRQTYLDQLNTATYQNVIESNPQKEGESRLEYIDRLNSMVPGFVDKAKGFGLTEPFEPGEGKKLKQWGKKSLLGVTGNLPGIAGTPLSDWVTSLGDKPVSGLTAQEAQDISYFQPLESLDRAFYDYALNPAMQGMEQLMRSPQSYNELKRAQRYVGPTQGDLMVAGFLNPANYVGLGEIAGASKLLRGTGQLLTKGPLRNTYKINPFANKTPLFSNLPKQGELIRHPFRDELVPIEKLSDQVDYFHLKADPDNLPYAAARNTDTWNQLNKDQRFFVKRTDTRPQAIIDNPIYYGEDLIDPGKLPIPIAGTERFPGLSEFRLQENVTGTPHWLTGYPKPKVDLPFNNRSGIATSAATNEPQVVSRIVRGPVDPWPPEFIARQKAINPNFDPEKAIYSTKGDYTSYVPPEDLNYKVTTYGPPEKTPEQIALSQRLKERNERLKQQFFANKQEPPPTSSNISMSSSDYVNRFNQNIGRLNEIISQNNKSGVQYRVKGLNEDGQLVFETPPQFVPKENVSSIYASTLQKELDQIDLPESLVNRDNRFYFSRLPSALTPSGGFANKQDAAEWLKNFINKETKVEIPAGQSTWKVSITPGEFTGEIGNITNAEDLNKIPGIKMQNTSNTVFSDQIPRKGSRAYQSINDYLKELNLGRVQSGQTDQTTIGRSLWQDLIKKNLATGFDVNDFRTMGIMKKHGGLHKRQSGGMLIEDNMGQLKYPGMNTRIKSNNITMKNVPYPVLGKANNGRSVVMQPNQDYYFPGADYVDEYPLPMYQSQGMVQKCPPGEYYNPLLRRCVPFSGLPQGAAQPPAANRAGNIFSYLPALSTAFGSENLNNIYNIPSFTKGTMDRARGQNIRTGYRAGALDAIRHAGAGAGAARGKGNMFLSNILGLGHELETIFDTGEFFPEETGADLYNNFVGSVIGALPGMTDEQRQQAIINAYRQGYLMDLGKNSDRVPPRPPSKRGTPPPAPRRKGGGSTYNAGVWFREGGQPCYECGGMYMDGGDIPNYMQDPNPLYNFGGYFPQAPRFPYGGNFIPFPNPNAAYMSVDEMKKGGINIKPSKRGTFTAAATRAGMGVQAFASKVLSAPEGRYTPAMRKKANFAKNASKWKHEEGGLVEGQVIDVTPDMLEKLKSGGYTFEIVND